MLKLIFTGDFAPLPDPENIPEDNFNSLTSLLRECDLHITNLECPLTMSDKAIEKTGPSIKGHPGGIELLKQANVGLACLANNHIFDYGEQGILDTINLCERNGIDTIGIVNRDDGHTKHLIKTIDDKKIGLINCCEHEFSVREPSLMGANGYDDIDAFYQITELRKQTDYLIVIYHGGNEYYPLPSPMIKKIFHYLADLGADTVIGHHSHVFSGYEWYNDTPLIYSLGNFFFPYPDEPEEWHKAIICELNISEQVELNFHPIEQCRNDLHVRLSDEATSKVARQEITKLSEIISDDHQLAFQWESYSRQHQKGLLKLFLAPGLFERLLLKLGVLRLRNFKHRSRVVKNHIRCQSLFNLLKQNLK